MKFQSGSKHILLIIICIVSLSCNAHSQSKEWEEDVIYSESVVPYYEL